MHNAPRQVRRHIGVCLPFLRHGNSLALPTRLTELLLPGKLLQLGLFTRNVSLQHSNLRLQNFALAFTLQPLLFHLVVQPPLFGLFMCLLSQSGGAGEYSSETKINVP
jgi:hypothetical protein